MRGSDKKKLLALLPKSDSIFKHIKALHLLDQKVNHKQPTYLTPG